MNATDFALKDWKALVGEHNRSSLDPMFSAAGWSPKAPAPPTSVPDWCGFAVHWWLHQADLSPDHRRSFFHCLNVEAFFTYGERSNVNPKRLMTEGLVAGRWEKLQDIHSREGANKDDGTVAEGHLRLWMSAFTIREVAKEFSFKPGDVVLINHYGKVDKAHHITMVLTYDSRSNLLTTIEGNATGTAGDNKRRRDSVVIIKRDLNKPTELNKLYGWGRCSKHDFKGSLIQAYR